MPAFRNLTKSAVSRHFKLLSSPYLIYQNSSKTPRFPGKKLIIIKTSAFGLLRSLMELRGKEILKKSDYVQKVLESCNNFKTSNVGYQVSS